MKAMLIIASIAMLLTACGDKIASKQDPLEEYKRYNEAVETYERKEYTAVEGTPTHEIIKNEDLNFVEGQKSSKQISVNILAANPENLKYTLQLSQGLKDYGVEIKKASEGKFELIWKPADSLLANNESSRKIPGKIMLSVLDGTSAELKKTFQHVTKEEPIELIVIKDKSVPVISGKISIPKQKLSLGQTTKATLNIEAFNITDKNDIELVLDPKTQKPAGELLETSSSYGVSEGPVLLMDSLTSDGHYKAKYEVSFDSNLYWENVQSEIAKDRRSSRSLRNGDYSEAEAVMVLVARNKKTGQSTSRSITIDIDLGFKPDSNQIVSESERVVIQTQKSTQKNTFDKFFVKSKNSQGNISVVSMNINDQSVTIEGTEKAKLAVENLSVEVSCRLMAATEVEKECITGQCLQRCDMKATSSCVAADQVKNLQINTINSLHGVELESTVIRQIEIKKSEESCEGAQS